MAKHLVRFFSSLLIAGTLFGFYLSQSGAPVRVHIAEGIPLLIAFIIPAQFISSFEDIEQHGLPVLGFMISGMTVREWLMLNAVSKYGFNPIVPILGLIFTALLLLLHMLTTWMISRAFRLPEHSNTTNT